MDWYNVSDDNFGPSLFVQIPTEAYNRLHTIVLFFHVIYVIFRYRHPQVHLKQNADHI